MKQIYNKVTVILLIALSLCGLSYYIQTKEKQKNIDMLFMHKLTEARDDLSFNYQTADETTKINHYTEMTSKLLVAINLLDLTSYKKQDSNDLFKAIDSLYYVTHNIKNMPQIINKQDELNLYLRRIISNTKDTEACKEMVKLTSSINVK